MGRKTDSTGSGDSEFLEGFARRRNREREEFREIGKGCVIERKVVRRGVAQGWRREDGWWQSEFCEVGAKWR